jgi:integrase
VRIEDFDPESCRFRCEFQRLEDGKLYRLKTPASRRSVDLPAPLRDRLVTDLARRREAALAGGKPPPKFLLAETLTHVAVRDAMREALGLARLPDHLTVHGLRHTFATLHLLRGAALLWVSRQLGHASVKITADTYGGWIQPESPGTADAFAERIAAKGARLATDRSVTSINR